MRVAESSTYPSSYSYIHPFIQVAASSPGSEDGGSWMGYLSKAVTASASYLPAQVEYLKELGSLWNIFFSVPFFHETDPRRKNINRKIQTLFLLTGFCNMLFVNNFDWFLIRPDPDPLHCHNEVTCR